ncbi:MAG: hypothetical protein SFU91_14490 [Chloroherpetonaceae bacterium]|nr:hypothetical protein [Chloroherpetonaceae bacterium]
MSKVEKTLEKWKNSNQPVPTNEVKSVLFRFFPDTKIREGTSHRYIISHPALKQNPHFAPKGTFLIPVKGNKVKPFYIKQILIAIELYRKYQLENE